MTKSISVKRPIIVKTIVTEGFKKRAEDQLLDEIKLIDTQINHSQVQLNQVIQQFQQGASNSMTMSPHEADQIVSELNSRLQQLINLKQNLHFQIENINNAQIGDIIVTGSLENYVDLREGDNIYDIITDKEILIKDGIVQEIQC